jgi:hypothetical protein
MSNYLPTAKSLSDSWLTIKLLAEAEPAFTEPAIRNHVFNAASRYTSKGTIPGNGLAPHIRRIGSKVLINHAGFLSWVDGSTGSKSPSRDCSNQDLSSPPGKCGNPPSPDYKGTEAESRLSALNAEPFAPEIQKIPVTSCSKQRSRRGI